MKIARGKGDGVFGYKEPNDLPMKFQIVEYSPNTLVPLIFARLLFSRTP